MYQNVKVHVLKHQTNYFYQTSVPKDKKKKEYFDVKLLEELILEDLIIIITIVKITYM